MLTLLALALVQAACARAIAEIDAGREPWRPRRLPPGVRQRLGAARALAVAVAVVTVLGISIFLLPVAIWLAVRWALLVPAVELEEQPRWARCAAALARTPAVAEGRHARGGRRRRSRSWRGRSSARS